MRRRHPNWQGPALAVLLALAGAVFHSILLLALAVAWLALGAYLWARYL